MFPTTKIIPLRIEIITEKSQKFNKIRTAMIISLIQLDSHSQLIQEVILLYYRLLSQCSILQQHAVNSQSSNHTHLHNHLVFQNTTTTIFQTHLSCQNMSLFSLLIREYQSILRRNWEVHLVQTSILLIQHLFPLPLSARLQVNSQHHNIHQKEEFIEKIRNQKKNFHVVF